jgi:hypothetical protein
MPLGYRETKMKICKNQFTLVRARAMLQIALLLLLGTSLMSGTSVHSIDHYKFYVYTLPEAINRHCIAQFSKYNWISDMGFEKWPPSRDDFHLNWMFAIEVCPNRPHYLESNLL